jgi:glycosyltransferase involved in cell wall biosynthesis
MADPLSTPGEVRRLALLSVVAPVFNEGDGVEALVSRLRATCSKTAASYELIVVNDGSRDATLPRLIALSEAIPQLRVVDLSRNYGHMAALSAGVALARGDAVVVMDGDLQDPPELIPELVECWRGGADVVYGLRTKRHEGVVVRLGTRLFYWLLRASRTSIPENVGTYCLMNRRVVDVLNAMPERSRFFAGLRWWVGGRQAFVAYERSARAHGRSRVGALGLLSLAQTALTSFSKVPLRLASILSLVCGMVLFLVGVIAILIRVFTPLGVPGWATYTTLIGMMGFVQSVVLAVIAEYVGIIFDEVKARPLFVVQSEFRSGSAVLVGSVDVARS